MRRPSAARVLWVLACLSGCAGSTREKGAGLVPLERSPAEVESALRPRRLALLVGINTFADDRWPGLHYAVADAMDMQAVLSDPARGAFDEVRLLAEPAGSSLAEIRAGLAWLAAENTSADDTVVLYFSTHGTLAHLPAGGLARFLVAGDTRQDAIAATGLRVRDLLETFERLASRRKLLVLAACHSGAGKSVLPESVTAELHGIKGAFFVQPLSEISQASMVLTACGWGETAREDDKLGHDIYTHFLLEALAGRDSDGDGAVTASEAHAHALSRTYYFSGGRQRPQVESSVLGADPIVLCGRRLRDPDPVLFSFLPQVEGLQLRVDGRAKGPLPARVPVEPGRRRVELCDADGRTLAATELELRRGDQIELTGLLSRRERRWSLEVRAGIQTFLDTAAREELVGPLGLVSLSLTRRDFPLRSVDTAFELTFGGSSQSLSLGGLELTQGLAELGYGLRLMLRLEFPPLVLLVGPRLAALHLLRQGIGGDTQHFANFTPGLLAALRWQLGESLSLDLEARMHYLSIHTSRGAQDSGLLDVLLGLGWGF